MIVQAYGGLCNRLRVVLSYYASGCRAFVWEPNGEIAFARWGDVFWPLDVHWHDTYNPSRKPDVVTCDPLPNVDWQSAYSWLRLNSPYARTWSELVAARPFDAIHVRRTDHQDYAKPEWITRDEEFHEWAARRRDLLFLATDNGTTQVAFKKLFGPRVFHAGAIAVHPDQDKGGRRNTSLARAAIDLFVCAAANEFMGSRASSFTDTIHTLRGMRGWWNAHRG